MKTKKSKQKIAASIDHANTKDLGHGVVEVVVSTNSLDRHGERLSIKGLDIKHYNGVVLLNHNYSDLPIGRSTLLKKKIDGDSEALISRTEFAIDQNPVAETVYKLVRDGFMPDVSIGFIPFEWDSESETWTKSEMIEYSHVTVGANRDAKVTAKAFNDALEKAGISPDEFEDEVNTFVHKTLEAQAATFDKLFSSPDEVNTLLQQAKALHETSEALVNSLTEAAAAPSDEESTASDKETDVAPQSKVRRIKLVTARKQAQAVDRIVEGLISELKSKK